MLLERGEHMVVLSRLMSECAAGQGRFAVITGAAMVGKSELLQSVAAEAIGRGFHVLHAIGMAGSEGSRLAVVEQLLDSLPEGCSDDLSQLNQLLYGRVTRMTAEMPTLIAIDDLHLAHVASIRPLLYLVRKCRNLPLMVAVTVGTGRNRPNPSLRCELLYRDLAQEIVVRPLSRAGVAQFAETLLGHPASDSVVDLWTYASGGNPALVQAMAVEAREVSPFHYGQTGLVCAERCGPDALALARCGAILGDLGSVKLLGALSGLDEYAIVQALADLAGCGLVSDARFRRQAVADALLDNMPRSEVARLRQRAAYLLHEEGATTSAVGEQLMLTEPIVAPWAVNVLLALADEAIAHEDVELAINCMRQASACCAEPQRKIAIEVRLGALVWRYKPGSVTQQIALTYSMDLLRHPDRHLLRVIRSLLWFDWSDRVFPLLEGARGRWERGDPLFDQELEETKTWLASTFPGLRDQVCRLLPDPDAVAGEGTVESITSYHGLLEVLRSADHSFPAQTVAEHTLQNITRPKDIREFKDVVAALLTLAYADQTEAASGWCNLMLEELPEHSAQGWIGTLLAVRAFILLREGRLDAAVENAEQAFDLIPYWGWGVSSGGPLSTLIEAHVAAGRLDDASEVVKRPVPALMFESHFSPRYLYARGLYHHEAGRYHAALNDFRACSQRMISWKMDNPALVPWRSASAISYLRIGDRARAAELIEQQLALTPSNRPRTRALTLLAKSALLPAERRLETLSDAMREAGRSRDRHTFARILAEMSQTCHDLGNKVRARRLRRRAELLAENTLSDEFAEDLMADDAESDEPERSGLEVLTAAELRVASLAAQGLSNREISSQLYITVSTVEQHLTRVYRKVNVRRREGLITRISQDLLDEIQFSS